MCCRAIADKTWLRVIMHEGRKRQIREVAGMLGHRVKYLERVRIGPLKLGQLKTGTWRHLTPTEVRELLASAGLDVKKPARRRNPRPENIGCEETGGEDF